MSRVPRELTFMALFLLQKRRMFFRASPKTQRASTCPEIRLGHGLDTSCGLVGPSLTQEHSLRITLYVAWCTMWSNVCNCRYHLSYSQLLTLSYSYSSYSSLSYSTLASLLSATLPLLGWATLLSASPTTLLSASLRNATRTSQLCEKVKKSAQVVKCLVIKF